MKIVPVYETVSYIDANGEPQQLRIVVAWAFTADDADDDVKSDAIVG